MNRDDSHAVKLLTLNISGLKTTLEDCDFVFYLHSFDTVGLTKTWNQKWDFQNTFSDYLC